METSPHLSTTPNHHTPTTTLYFAFFRFFSITSDKTTTNHTKRLKQPLKRLKKPLIYFNHYIPGLLTYFKQQKKGGIVTAF
jgi:hypothetical protein